MLLAMFSDRLFSLLLPGFDAAEVALVSRYFWIMAPAIVLMAMNAFHEYVCLYDEDYVSVVAIRMALPGLNLAAILLLGPFVGEYCLPIGYMAGNLTLFGSWRAARSTGTGPGSQFGRISKEGVRERGDRDEHGLVASTSRSW